MKKLILKSYSILNDNLLFIQPILIYILLIMISSQNLVEKSMGIIPKTTMILSVVLFAIAITTGLLYINKKAISDYNPEDSNVEIAKKSIKNFKTFFAGIGEYFSKIISGTILYVGIYMLIFYLISIYLSHTIGIPPIKTIIEEFNKIENIEQINAYANSFNRQELIVINIWSLVFIIASLVFKFLGILYGSILISEKDNIFFCFFKMIIFFLKNLFPSIFIIVFMMFLYLTINLLTMVIGMNSIVFGLFFIFIALYLNYYIILVLNFYNERTKTNSNNRTECIG